MRNRPNTHALKAIPYVRTELQLRFACCMTGLTMEQYNSDDRKRPKEKKVILMTSHRDLMIDEGAAVACSIRRDSFIFVRYMLERFLVPAQNT